MPSVRGVGENVIAGLIGAVIIAAIGWAASRFDAPVQVWVVVVCGGVAFALGVWLGRLLRIGEDLAGYQADLLGEATLGLSEMIAGNLGIEFREFIERGVLAPAQYGLSTVRGEDIRLSILVLDEGAGEFRMLYEAGHSLGRKDNFSLPKVSLAGHAIESKRLEWSNDVNNDARWQRHPKASDDRGYRSLASMPIVVGGAAVAVLNVVSSEKGAFLQGDLTYIELLGGFIGLAWAMQDTAEASRRLGP